MTDYLVIYERTDTGWSAYVPDLPGCVTAGDTREEREAMADEAVQLFLEDLRETCQPIPEPSTEAGYVVA